MVLNSTNVVLVRWYVALLKISNPSGFISRTPQFFRMPGLPASGKPVLGELHHCDAQVPLFHYGDQIRLYGSSFLHQILSLRAHLAKPLTSVYQCLKDRMPDFPMESLRFQSSSLGSHSGISFQNVELFGRSFWSNLLKNNI
jgi:hypothetical protein